MTSWRDLASPQAQDDLDQLTAHSIELAQQLLARHHEFYPFSIVVNVDGSTEGLQVQPDRSPDVQDAKLVLSACIAAAVARQSGIRAAVFVADVRQQTGTDAIRLDLEHCEGQALTVLLPYTRLRSGQIRYGAITASAGPNQVWPAPDR